MYCIINYYYPKYSLILLADYKKILKEDADSFTDEELQKAIDQQTQLANIAFDYWQEKNKQNINNQ